MDCIDLQERFGDRYRIGFDPAYDPRGRKHLDPWMMLIPCRFGTIYPSGGDKLRVDIDGHVKLAKKVATIAGCRLVQDGDDEKTFEFPANLFNAVAKIVKPRRKAQSRANILHIGHRTRFSRQVNTASISTSQP